MNSNMIYYTEYVRDDLHPKYIMTNMTKDFNGYILHRIKSVSDFAYAQYGELGGWIEKEENLSQDGDCWVAEGGMVYGDAKVSGNAQIRGNAKVFGKAQVYGNSIMFGNSCVFGNANIYENVILRDSVIVCDHADISGSISLNGQVVVRDNAKMQGHFGCRNDMCLGQDAYIQCKSDYLCIGPIGSRNDTTTFYKIENGKIYVICGCFEGDIDEFSDAVERNYGDENSPNHIYAIQYRTAILLAKSKILK